jgi:hypothetical protein
VTYGVRERGGVGVRSKGVGARIGFGVKIEENLEEVQYMRDRGVVSVMRGGEKKITRHGGIIEARKRVWDVA